MNTIISALRARLISDPSDKTLISLRLELEDASDWLKTLANLPAGVRKVAISFSTSKNVEEDEYNPYLLHGEELERFEKQFKAGL
jgi:hypothetical protein